MGPKRARASEANLVQNKKRALEKTDNGGGVGNTTAGNASQSRANSGQEDSLVALGQVVPCEGVAAAAYFEWCSIADLSELNEEERGECFSFVIVFDFFHNCRLFSAPNYTAAVPRTISAWDRGRYTYPTQGIAAWGERVLQTIKENITIQTISNSILCTTLNKLRADADLSKLFADAFHATLWASNHPVRAESMRIIECMMLNKLVHARSGALLKYISSVIIPKRIGVAFRTKLKAAAAKSGGTAPTAAPGGKSKQTKKKATSEQVADAPLSSPVVTAATATTAQTPPDPPAAQPASSNKTTKREKKKKEQEPRGRTGEGDREQEEE